MVEGLVEIFELLLIHNDHVGTSDQGFGHGMLIHVSLDDLIMEGEQQGLGVARNAVEDRGIRILDIWGGGLRVRISIRRT